MASGNTTLDTLRNLKGRAAYRVEGIWQDVDGQPLNMTDDELAGLIKRKKATRLDLPNGVSLAKAIGIYGLDW